MSELLDPLYTDASPLVYAIYLGSDIFNKIVKIGQTEVDTYGTSGSTFIIGNGGTLSVYASSGEETGYGGTVYGAIASGGVMKGTNQGVCKTYYYDIQVSAGIFSTYKNTTASNVTVYGGKWVAWQQGSLCDVTIYGGDVSLGGTNASMNDVVINGGTFRVEMGIVSNWTVNGGFVNLMVSQAVDDVSRLPIWRCG